MIGWSKLDRWYYGVRFAKNSKPTDLWTTYFTSSKKVKEYRKKFGEPDVIQIRRTFNDSSKARLWENKVLKRMNVVFDTRWLNQCANMTVDPKIVSEANKGKKKPKGFGEKIAEINRNRIFSEKTRQKMSAIHKGKKASPELREKMSRLRKGKKLSDHHKHQISKARIGISPWNKGRKLSETHKQAMKDAWVRRKCERNINAT